MGISFQGAPVLKIKRMPSRISRAPTLGRPCRSELNRTLVERAPQFPTVAWLIPPISPLTRGLWPTLADGYLNAFLRWHLITNIRFQLFEFFT